MMTKLMKTGVLLSAFALVVSGCFKLDNNSSYEANILVHYEPDNEYENEEFLAEFFRGGADSVLVSEYLTYGPVIHYSKLSSDKKLVGGFALCTGIDTIATPERRPARFAVFDNGGCNKSLAYAVFHDTTSTLMPEHLISFYVPSTESSCTLKSISVQNVQAVAQAAKFGTGLSGGPFTDTDFLTLTLTGYKGSASTGNKSIKLVDGTKLLDKWTAVDISSLGSVDYLELHLEASRPDCPLYCCIDNLYLHYVEKY